jgi:chemotaxis protein CheZ
MPSADFLTRRRSVLAHLNHAYASGDEAAFERALDEVMLEKTSALMADVQRLSQSLLSAMGRFRSDSRFAELAAREMPDAKLRLDHVLKMTEDAAHRTLDIIEQSAPLADITVKRATELMDTLDDRSHNDIRLFLEDVRKNADKVRENLTEVMLAQGFQDLTGQILRGVRTLVVEVESTLKDFADVAGVSLAAKPASNAPDITPEGPAIPNITRNAVNAQSDVDDLIAGLGI